MTDIVERVAEDDLVAFRGRVDQVLHSAVDKRRPDADFATAVDDARRPQGVLAKHAGLSAFIVDMHAPGVDMRPIRQIAGGTDFNEVFFSEVVLEQESAPDRAAALNSLSGSTA